MRPGYIVFARGSGLFAAPFDLRRLRLTGPPVPVLNGIATNPATGASHFSISAVGDLVYAQFAPGAWDYSLLWVRRDGTVASRHEVRSTVEQQRVSPDGNRIALTIIGAQNDVGVYDVERRRLDRITFSSAEDGFPTWTPDGKRVTYYSTRGGRQNVYWKRVDGTGDEERLVESDQPLAPLCWSPDGRVLLYVEQNPETGSDLWALDLAHGMKRRPFICTPFNEDAAEFSPDGRWVAYESNETGRTEVYVRSFESPEERWQVSEAGGINARWAADGSEIFFLDGERNVWSVPVRAGETFVSLSPRRLFQSRNYERFDISPENGAFIMRSEPLRPTRLVVSLRWAEEVARRLRERH
jgi:dipeptidyl aminopeptidase/acylaminoacyl peptidase